jgi:HPt (histidine-containing phosphotransfer) domain-containing protein
MSLPVTLDPEELRKRLGGNSGLLAELIDIFRTEAPNYLALIRGGIAGNDACAVRQASHKLHGALCYFGVAPACELAQQLEQLGCSGRLAEAGEVCSQLEARLRTLLEELQRLVADVCTRPGGVSS